MSFTLHNHRVAPEYHFMDQKSCCISVADVFRQPFMVHFMKLWCLSSVFLQLMVFLLRALVAYFGWMCSSDPRERERQWHETEGLSGQSSGSRASWPLVDRRLLVEWSTHDKWTREPDLKKESCWRTGIINKTEATSIVAEYMFIFLN